MYDCGINRLHARMEDLETKLPRPDPEGARSDALLEMIQKDPDLRKAALRWFAAHARGEPQAAQLKEELARLIYLKQQGGTNQ